MVYCDKCGAEIKEDARFCPKCGASLFGNEYKKQEAPECFGWERGGGVWGIVAIGVFLIGLAILFYLDLFWPGVIFLIGFMVIVGAIISYYTRSSRRVGSST